MRRMVASRMRAAFALVSVLSLGLFILDQRRVSGQGQRAADPRSDGAENVTLVGYHDLQGRQSLQVMARSDAANGNWLYVGHSPNNRTDPEEPQLNPITGQREWNGTSILEISDPANPKLVWHIPNDVASVNSRAVSVVYDYKHSSNPAGRDYLIRSWDTGKEMKFQIFDITTRGTNPKAIALVSEITGTPPNSCGPGCGGKFIYRAHKGYWSETSGLYYAASGEPGFRNTSLSIWDLKDPRNPKFVGRAWFPGMKDTEDKALYQGQYVHHPTVDEANNRMYIGGRNASGFMGSWDISNPASPKMIWLYDMNPPARGPHTITPIRYDTVPNFKGNALPRTYAFVTDESSDLAPCTNGVRAKAYMFDITHESNPMPVAVWEVPVGNFCDKGGRFGPHQHAEFVNGRLNRHENKLAWVAYFNAGIRVVDLANPYNLKEAGYYIPKTTAKSHPMAKGQATAIQINDVTIDHRGLAYATDRVGTGLFVLQYTGSAGTAKATP
jgi:hypothetical protein